MARILIVDDTPDVCVLLAKILKLGGHESRTANGGEEALQIVGEDWPDLIMLDISMPGMNGFDVLQRLDGSSTSTPPVVMMTAFNDHYSRQRAMDLGARDYLVKGSFEIDDMLARIDQIISEEDRQASGAAH